MHLTIIVELSIRDLYETSLFWKKEEGKETDMDTGREMRIYEESRKWIYGTVIMEDGICLIENEEGIYFCLKV